MPKNYDEEKFANFNKGLADSKANKLDTIVVYDPTVLGDDYYELVENLSRIAEAGLKIGIVKRAPPIP